MPKKHGIKLKGEPVFSQVLPMWLLMIKTNYGSQLCVAHEAPAQVCGLSPSNCINLLQAAVRRSRVLLRKCLMGTKTLLPCGSHEIYWHKTLFESYSQAQKK